jgi:transcriptional regulator with XRE-family HTH domain
MKKRAAKAMGKRLAELRRTRGLSQPRLAAAAGASVSAVRQWEQVLRLPSFEMAYNLARALGVSLDELAGKVFETPKRKGKEGGAS